MSEPAPAPPAPRRGDVRVKAHLSPAFTAIEVADGEGNWHPIRGVTKIQFSMEAREKLPETTLTIKGAFVELLTPNERVGLEIVKNGRTRRD